MLFHDEPGTLVRVITAAMYPICTLEEFVLDCLLAALACVDDRFLLVFRLFVDIPGLEAVALVAHQWGSLAMGVGIKMPPEETSLLTILKPDDVGMRSQRRLLIDGRANMRLPMDEEVDRISSQETVGKEQLKVLLAERHDLRKVPPRRC